MSPSTDEISRSLIGLQTATSGIKSALLVGTDGSILGSSMASPTERAQLSGVSAAAFAVARKAAKNLSLGDLERVHMRCRSGSVLLVNIGEKAILAMALADGLSPDQALAAARTAIQQIQSRL